MYTRLYGNKLASDNKAFTDAEWIAINGVKADKAMDENGKYGSPASLNASSSRVLTVKVKGVKTFKLYATNSNKDADRIASISIDNGTATTYTHDGRSSSIPYDFATIELDGEEHTLVIKGGAKTIYLTAIELLSE